MSIAIRPKMSAAVGLAISGSTNRIALPAGYSTFRLHNRGTGDAFLVTGGSTIEATASDTGHTTLGPGCIEVLTIESPIAGTVYLAGIGTDGSINITPCLGGL